MFIRFKNIPNNEQSSIWKGEECVGKEIGVSVYETCINSKGEYSIVIPTPITDSTLDTLYSLIKYSNDAQYLVEGDIVGYGKDNEPLIKNVKIVKELKRTQS